MVKGIIEGIQCVGHLQLHGLVIYTVGPTAEVLLFWKTMPCYDGPGFYSTANLKDLLLHQTPVIMKCQSGLGPITQNHFNYNYNYFEI